MSTSSAGPAPSTNADEAPSDRSETVALVLLLIGALLVRLPGLTDPLWFDELWSTRVVLGNLGDALFVSVQDLHPPGYNALMYAWTRVFGDSELSVRTIPLLAGLGTIALMPALGARLATRRAGWLAAALLAASPVHIWYSQEARAYSLVMFISVALVLVWRRLDEPDPPSWMADTFIVLVVVLLQLHYFAVAVPAVLALCAIWQRRLVKVTIWGLVLGILGVAVIASVKAVAGAWTTQAWYLRPFTLHSAGGLFTWFTHGGALTAEETGSVLSMRLAARGVTAFIAVLLATWLAIGWRRDRRAWSELLLLVIAVPSLLLLLNALGLRNFYIERSALPSLPFFLLAVAAGATAMASAAWRRVVIVVTATAACLVLIAYRARQDESTVFNPNQDWTTASRVLEARDGRDVAPLLVFSTTALKELVYYVPMAAECPWPPRPTTMTPSRGWRRHLETSPRLTCGPNGTASTRLYVVPDSSPRWIDDVRAYENGAQLMLVVNEFWLGQTRGLVDALRAEGRSLEQVARLRGLEIYSVE